MKNLIFLLGLALLAPGRAALAQTQPPKAATREVTGIVLNGRTALPIHKVVVLVKDDANLRTVTDSTGHFRLRVPQATTAVLEFRKYGYQPIDKPLAEEKKATMKVWFDRIPPNWKSKKALARDSARQAQQNAQQQTAGVK